MSLQQFTQAMDAVGFPLPAVVSPSSLGAIAVPPAMCGIVCRWEIFFRTGSIIFGGGQVGALSLMVAPAAVGQQGACST